MNGSLWNLVCRTDLPILILYNVDPEWPRDDIRERLELAQVLGISTVLGVIGVVAAFGPFYLGERVFHLDHAHIQTLMYLKLSVAGHLTIFLTRTRGPFWSIRPARILWIAVLGTQILATLIAVYGLFMTPLGWGWALFVWGYALVWFLVNDRVKLIAYRIFDPAKAKTPSDLMPQIAK
jgi:H+-transporting ATPase